MSDEHDLACGECGDIFSSDALLTLPNPFPGAGPDDLVFGCPCCLEPVGAPLTHICGADGCGGPAGLTADGWRCHKHRAVAQHPDRLTPGMMAERLRYYAFKFAAKGYLEDQASDVLTLAAFALESAADAVRDAHQRGMEEAIHIISLGKLTRK